MSFLGDALTKPAADQGALYRGAPFRLPGQPYPSGDKFSKKLTSTESGSKIQQVAQKNMQASVQTTQNSIDPNISSKIGPWTFYPSPFPRPMPPFEVIPKPEIKPIPKPAPKPSEPSKKRCSPFPDFLPAPKPIPKPGPKPFPVPIPPQQPFPLPPGPYPMPYPMPWDARSILPKSNMTNPCLTPVPITQPNLEGASIKSSGVEGAEPLSVQEEDYSLSL